MTLKLLALTALAAAIPLSAVHARSVYVGEVIRAGSLGFTSYDYDITVPTDGTERRITWTFVSTDLNAFFVYPLARDGASFEYFYTYDGSIGVRSRGNPDVYQDQVNSTGKMIVFQRAEAQYYNCVPNTHFDSLAVACGDYLEAFGNGTPLILYSKADATITSVTETVVPEPATWALMISGFGMVGAAVRRRAAGAKAV